MTEMDVATANIFVLRFELKTTNANNDADDEMVGKCKISSASTLTYLALMNCSQNQRVTNLQLQPFEKQCLNYFDDHDTTG